MGYYHCKNCGHMFETPYRDIPSKCTLCGSPYNLNSIQKQQYHMWIKIRENSSKYRQLKQEGIIL